MTRIIGGVAKGRRLKVPGSGTRPTADRVRESLFNMLEHRYGDLSNVSVADVFAGSGALGLEAASRGASPVVLVESDRQAIAAITSNIAATGLSAHVAGMDAKVWAEGPAAEHAPYDILFLDPPYAMGEEAVMALVSAIGRRGLLAPECDVLYECAKPRHGEQDSVWPAGFTQHAVREYGDTRVRHGVWYGHSA